MAAMTDRVIVYGLFRRNHYSLGGGLGGSTWVLISWLSIRRLACRDFEPQGASSTLLRITALRCARRTRAPRRLQPAMSNTVYLSSSPAVAAIGRSSSPDFPTLDELVTQEPRPVSQPLAQNTLSRTVESGWRGNPGKGRAAVASKEPPRAEDGVEDTADASLVEIDQVDFAAAARGETKSKKSSTDEKAPRARGSGTKTAAQKPTADAPTEDATTATTDPQLPKPRRKHTGAVSRHFKAQSETARSRKPAETEKPEEPLNIETALSRRGAWTPPPKDTIQEFGSRSSDIIEFLSSTSKVQGTEKPRDIFQSLQETYGYELEADPFLVPEPGDVQAVFKKRKLIEMVSTNGTNAMPPPPLPEASPTKTKAPKKKARTITGLATEAYAPEDTELPLEPAGASAATANPVAEPAKPKPKRTTKRKPKAPKKEDPRMVLYSPEAAMKQVTQQDFVFGTSSQLVREQDRAAEPELPRLRDSMSVIEEEYVTPINSDAIEPPEVQPKLWTAGARDAEGELLHPEVVDLVEDSPDGEVVVSDDSDPFGYGYVNLEKTYQRQSSGASCGAGSRLSISKSTSSSLRITPSLKAASQSLPTKQPESPAVVHDPLLGPMSSTSPPPSSQKRLSSIFETNSVPPPSAQTESPTRVTGYTAPEKPRFELYTDAQLARQVAAYGFKPVKRRAGMISLLDECWTSRYQRGPGAGVRAYSTGSAAAAEEATVGEAAEPAAQAVVEPVKRPRGRPRKNSPVPAPAPLPAETAASEPVPAKRPRGRPRKAAAPAVAPKEATTQPAPSTPRKKKAPVVEIPDTDSAPSSPEPIFSSPDPNDVSLPTDDSLALAPTTEEANLHAYITKAVTSAPRSDDPEKPSWWEKMLMYESVIVEDLAAWLNMGGLDAVGFDGEVSAEEVKGWCEAKSVCCVWRMRAGGAERKVL